MASKKASVDKMDPGAVPSNSKEGHSNQAFVSERDEENGANAAETKKFAYDNYEFKDEKPPLASCEKCFKASRGVIKVVVSALLNLVLLGCLVIQKGCLLYTTSQVYPAVTFNATTFADDTCDVQATCIYNVNGTSCQENDSVRWLWSLFITQCTPYFLMFLACIWQMCFKMGDTPKWQSFVLALIVETLQSIGIFILLYVILPFIDVFRGLLLLSAVAIVPCFLQLFHDFDYKKMHVLVFDMLAFVTQFSAFIIWPVAYPLSSGVTMENNDELLGYCERSKSKSTMDMYSFESESFEGSIAEYEIAIYLIPLALVLCSVSWWDNFVDEETSLGRVMKFLLELRKDYSANKIKPKLYAVVSLYKILITFVMLVIYYATSGFYTNISNLFSPSNFHLNRCDTNISDDDNAFLSDWISVAMINVCVSVIAFYTSGFAIKAHMQRFSFALPLLCATPLTFLLLWWACERCHEEWDLPLSTENVEYYWNCYQGYDTMGDSFVALLTYVGFFWWISQFWAVRHLAFPRIERLAQLDKIFTRPMHCGVLLEQSLMFIRRRDDEEDITVSKDLKEDPSISIKIKTKAKDKEVEVPEGCNPLFGRAKTTPYIYMCATMWHENKREMIQLLISVLRTDFDSWLKKNLDDPDMYEFELNIYFDDAFAPPGKGQPHSLNEFVEQFLECYEEAKRTYFEKEWHGKKGPTQSAPTKCVTPYGGQLVFRLPFDSKMILHLKDKRKIRNRKRWSQVMYMFSLVGQQIRGLGNYTEPHRAQVAENSYILALDGDVDFQAEALTLLLDLMKRDKKVAAACGRIHPIGDGPMVWYQKFEYCLSHWLQKATEHVLGCVLCSPGCFSLFRCSKIEDVMARYSHLPEGARQHVQFDQGEDRWLCTLLLQQGHRIEYSAASDAYTYAPEEFKEFFNQRRRWITSTYANVMDLLADGRYTAKKNDNISMLYIFYQGLLFGSSILGPATIFLLIVGAFNAVFQVGLGLAIFIGLIPLAIFLVLCYKCKEDTQVTYAAILSAVLAVLQTLVLIGLIRQMVEDGICSPTSFFTLFVLGIFVLAAILHPQEGFNLVYLPVFFLLVPCMYLILIIYSLCNVKSTSWGTREKPAEQNQNTANAGSSGGNGLMKYFGMGANRTSSGRPGYTLRCSNWCSMTCCGDTDASVEVMRELKQEILHGDKEDSKRGAGASKPNDGKKQDDDKPKTNEDSAEAKAAEAKKIKKELENTDWLNHKQIKDWAITHISEDTTEFWNEFIHKYLKPLNAGKSKEQIQKDTDALGDEMAELRDKVVFGFFMIDVLLIATILGMSLTIQQVPDMAIKWNCTVSGAEYTSTIDPIGFLFLIVFGFILVIQLIGMLLHRMFTFLQVLSVGSGSSRGDATDYAKKKLMGEDKVDTKEKQEDEETKPQDEEANQPPKEETKTKPVDKDELTDNLAAIVQTAKFGKMWKEKMNDNHKKPAKNAVVPVEEVPKREKEYYEPHKDFAPTKKHWWEIAEQPKKAKPKGARPKSGITKIKVSPTTEEKVDSGDTHDSAV